MRNFNTNTDNHDEWLTPPEIIRALGPFDLDPCAPVNRPWDTANDHYLAAGQAVTACGAGRAQAPALKQEPAYGAAR